MSPAPTVTAPTKNGEAVAVSAPVVPFVRASLEHVEPFLDTSLSADQAASVAVSGGPIDVPAYGYMRAIVLEVAATGGTGTAAVYKEDAPWSVIEEIQLYDVNGGQLVGPLSGYDLYLINKWGGYAANHDPVTAAAYTAPATSGNYRFQLRIPVELCRRDALGSLPNMNASSTYKLRLTMSAKASVYSTNPTGYPTVAFKCWLEAWAPPNAADVAGAPQAVQPPAMGTTQFWTKNSPVVPSGAQTVRLVRVGNLIRTLILTFRNTSDGLRSDTNFPDPLQMMWDGRQVFNASRNLLKQYMRERGVVGVSLDTGVVAVTYSHDFDGKIGDEMRDLWLRTTQSSRLELVGSFGAAGTLSILTNDVSPNGDVFLAS